MSTTHEHPPRANAPDNSEEPKQKPKSKFSHEISYNSFFGLDETPFSIAPNPRFLFMSEQHQEALAHLLYGVNAANGFVLLTGEVGTGKTTVIRAFLQHLPDDARVAYVLHATLTAQELLETIAEELNVPMSEWESQRALVAAIHQKLLEHHSAGFRTFLLIDEAQNLAADVLEEIRMLTNLETDDGKLLHIILVGQPELRDIFEAHNMRQLNQRITARYHLQCLSVPDVALYVQHRLAVAQAPRNPFTPKAIKTIARVSGGVPRLINVVADRSLLAGFAQQQFEIDHTIVRTAAREVSGRSSLSPTLRRFFQRHLFKRVRSQPQGKSLKQGAGLNSLGLGSTIALVLLLFGICALVVYALVQGSPESTNPAANTAPATEQPNKASRIGSEKVMAPTSDSDQVDETSLVPPIEEISRKKDLVQGPMEPVKTPGANPPSPEASSLPSAQVPVSTPTTPTSDTQPVSTPIKKILNFNAALVLLQDVLGVKPVEARALEEFGCEAFSAEGVNAPLGCVEVQGPLQSLIALDIPFTFKMAPGQLRSIGIAFEPETGQALARHTWFVVTGFEQEYGVVSVQGQGWSSTLKLDDLNLMAVEDGFFLMASPLPTLSSRQLLGAQHGQWILSRMGYADGSAFDPLFDIIVSPATFRASVRGFQERHGLTQDGLFGVKTLVELNRALVPTLTRL